MPLALSKRREKSALPVIKLTYAGMRRWYAGARGRERGFAVVQGRDDGGPVPLARGWRELEGFEKNV